MQKQCGPNLEAEISSDVVRDWLSSLLAQPDGGLVPTPALRPEHADSTPPAALWSNRSGSLLPAVTQTHAHKRINTHADFYLPSALRGGDQLAGNEAVKN